MKKLNLSSEEWKLVARYVTAVNNRWLCCGDYLYQAGMKDVMLLLENKWRYIRRKWQKENAGWNEKLADLYNLSEVQKEELQVAVIESGETVELNIKNASMENRELAISFARHFDTLDEETSRKIFDILKRKGKEVVWRNILLNQREKFLFQWKKSPILIVKTSDVKKWSQSSH